MKTSCFTVQQKTFDQLNSCRKCVKCLCDPPDGNESIVEHLPTSKANVYKLQSVGHLVIGLYALSHITLFGHVGWFHDPRIGKLYCVGPQNKGKIFFNYSHI